APPPFDCGPAALCSAALPPSATRPRRPLLSRPRRPLLSCPAALPSRPQPPYLHGPAAAERPCISRAAQSQPCRPAEAEPPGSHRAAEQQSSRPAAAGSPWSRQAAQEQPSRLGAAGPPRSRRAAQKQPSRPGAAEPPSDRRAALPALPSEHRTAVVVMATPSVLAFDAEGRAVDFEVWVDDLQLFSQCDRADGLSLYHPHSRQPRDGPPRSRAEHSCCRSLSRPRWSRDVPTPQQLREWYTQRQRGGGFGPCTYVLRTGDRAGEQCGGTHTAQCCFRRLMDAWRQQFPEAAEIPRWGELSRAGVAIFIEFDAILAAMYAVTISDEGDCYRCFPPDPGIGTSALGASEASALGASASVLSGVGETALSGTGASALSGPALASTSLTFTLDSGASRSFFRDRTTLTPLSRPVAVSLADPSGGPVLSRFSTVLPCPAAPSGTLSGLYLPLFSTNLVSRAALQDAGVHQFTPARQRVTHCTEASTGRHLATFT
ncbi:unnamed protein product, partial [Closterium sp. NIES-54]